MPSKYGPSWKGLKYYLENTWTVNIVTAQKFIPGMSKTEENRKLKNQIFTCS